MQAGIRDLPQEFIDGHKRQRVVPAAAAVAHEHGIGGATATRILREARMSRNTFYDLFRSRENCLRFCFAEAYGRIFDPVEAMGEEPGPWIGRVTESLDALFAAVTHNPLLAEFCLVQSVGAPEEAEGHDGNAAVETLSRAIDGGRAAGRKALGPAYHDPAPETEELLAGGVIALTAMRIRQGRIESLPGHTNELVQLIATPFLGPTDASRHGRALKAA